MPNANKTIDVKKRANRRRIVRHPVGTNHFQFRVHQFRLGGSGLVGGVVVSIALFYFKWPELYNLSSRPSALELRFVNRQDDLMKTQRLFLVLLAGSLGAFLSSCAMYPKSGSGALVGTWTNSLGTVWTINADGMFDADLDKDGKRDAWGTWKVDGATVMLLRKGGIKPKGCEGKGIYRFNRSSENDLQFTLVEDKCKVRIKNVTQPWKRK